jgi:hypothetical protein
LRTPSAWSRQQANAKQWIECPTCEQRWGDQTYLALAQAHFDLLAGPGTADEGRLGSAVDLVHALEQTGHLEEALQRGTEERVATKFLLGAEHRG